MKLQHDYSVYIKEHEIEDFTQLKRFAYLLLKTTFPIILFYRLANHKNKIIRFLSIPIYKIIRIISGVQIPRSTEIGKGLFLPHYGNIVLNKNATYGEFLTIYHNVTVGAKGSASADVKTPIIGNNVRLSAGCIVLGGIVIEDNVTIGAGCVVIKSIPENKVVVGNPAKIIN